MQEYPVPEQLEEGAREVMPEAASTEGTFELSLRPKSLAEFIGQDELKRHLQVSIAAARGRGEGLEHVLFYGSPGLGKTTLANIIAMEMGGNLRVTSGPALERVGDLAAILTNLQAGDVLFVDEIHRMHKNIEEVLYPAMEDFALDLVVGKGPSARTLRLPLQRFTLIGATTKLSSLGSPLRDRFGMTYHLEFYQQHHVQTIVERSAALLGITLATGASAEIASRARRTPRIANRLLKRVRDYAQVHGDGTVTQEVAQATMEMLRVDAFGLDETDRQLLRLIIEKFGGGPVGLAALAAASGEELGTIEDVYEPYLLQAGFLERSPRGRVATPAAYTHLGL